MIQKGDRMASISRMLRREREPSMYRDEELALPQMNSIHSRMPKQLLIIAHLFLTTVRNCWMRRKKCNKSNNLLE